MWTEKNNTLKRLFIFDNFSEAFAFMTQVAFLAEKLNHHPTWTNTWNKVTIELTTHDEGNKITAKDLKMSAAIDALIKK